MQFRGGISELMRQAARMQRKIDERKAQIKDEEITATAAGDKVKVIVTCEGKLRQIIIDPELLSSDVELALDAVVAASNSALEQADKKVDEEINKITGGIKIPGL